MCQLGSDPSRQGQRHWHCDRMVSSTSQLVALDLWCRSVLYQHLFRRNPCDRKHRCLSFQIGNQGSKHSSQSCENCHGILDTRGDHSFHSFRLLYDIHQGSCDRHHGHKNLAYHSRPRHYGSQWDISTSKRVHHRHILLCTSCSKEHHLFLCFRGTSHRTK